MALVLIKPELDKWAPGEHNGTFRGHNPGFVTATKALDYWENDWLEKAVAHKSKLVDERLNAMVKKLGADAEVRGRGLIYGIAFEDDTIASKVSQACFKDHLIVETAGIDDQVLKLLPSLTISDEDLSTGLDIIEKNLAAVLKSTERKSA
jgi:diaminobutyrate-2-oxoglutarate transaminase